MLDHVDPQVVCGLVREWVQSASPEDARFVPKPSVVAAMWAARQAPALAVTSDTVPSAVTVNWLSVALAVLVS